MLLFIRSFRNNRHSQSISIFGSDSSFRSFLPMCEDHHLSAHKKNSLFNSFLRRRDSPELFQVFRHRFDIILGIFFRRAKVVISPIMKNNLFPTFVVSFRRIHRSCFMKHFDSRVSNFSISWGIHGAWRYTWDVAIGWSGRSCFNFVQIEIVLETATTKASKRLKGLI